MIQAAFDLRHTPVEIPESELRPPVVTYLAAERRWRLEEPYRYRDGPTLLEIPRHFSFDMASIPRLFWWLVAPFELSISAPLIHDFLYRYAGAPPIGSLDPPRSYDRKEADALFREVMRQEGVATWRWRAAYIAVRRFGSGAWGKA